jgi:mRNA interferase MazF
VIVSVDKFNHGPADLVIAIPISKAAKRIPTHVEIDPPEGGVTAPSFIKCEAIRSISKVRLVKPMGKVSDRTMEAVEDRIKIPLDLPSDG